MSTATAYSAIKAFLDANWSATELLYENEANSLPDSPTAMIMVEITGSSYFQASIGASTKDANLWREDGLLWLHVLVPSGTGSLAARTHAQNLIILLRSAELVSGRLVFGDASLGIGEPGDDNGNYWRLPVSIQWRLDF